MLTLSDSQTPPRHTARPTSPLHNTGPHKETPEHTLMGVSFPQRTSRPFQTPEDTTTATLLQWSHVTKSTPPQGHFYTHQHKLPPHLGTNTPDRQCIAEHCYSFLAREGKKVLAAPGSRRELCLSRSCLGAVALPPRPPRGSPKGSPCIHARAPSTISPPGLFALEMGG